MKNKRTLVLGVVPVILFTLALSGCASLHLFPLAEIVGEWEGPLNNPIFGEGIIHLSVFDKGGGNVEAIYTWKNIPGNTNIPELSTRAKVSYDSPTHTNTFASYEWIGDKPKDYVNPVTGETMTWHLDVRKGTVENGVLILCFKDGTIESKLVKK